MIYYPLHNIFITRPSELFCKKRCFQKFCLRPATLLKKSLWHRCFPVNFAKFLRTSYLQNTSGQLLLYILDFLNVHICICFGRYSEGIPALHKTEIQTRVMHDLAFWRKPMQFLLFSIFHAKLYFCLLVQFLMFWNSIGTLTNPIRQVKSTRKFFHALKVFPNSFCSCSLKNNLTRKLILKDSAIELTVGPRVLDSWVQTPPSTLFIP